MTSEVIYVAGRVQIITDIECPLCHCTFEEGGDADGRLVVCPSCGVYLMVRKDDGA